MAIISNETYLERLRERQRADSTLREASGQAPSTGSGAVDPTALALVDSPLACSTSSPQAASPTPRQGDSAGSAKPPVVSLSNPQAASPARVSVLSKVELPARAPVTNSAPELEPGEIPDEDRTVEVALSRVSEPQAAALRALVEGRTTVQAAAEAGVDRGTLYRWRTQDRDFMAALNAWRADMVAQARDRMLALADKAVNAVAGGLDKGDARLGLRVLKDLECSRVGKTEPDDPEQFMRAGEIRTPQQESIWQVVRKMSGEQTRRVAQIIQMGLDADNARIAAASGEPVESGRGESIGAARGERVESQRDESAHAEAAANETPVVCREVTPGEESQHEE